MRHRILVALLAAALLAVSATAAGASTAARLVAPPGECPAADDPRAHHRAQRLAMHCLVRFARTVAQRPDVASSTVLRHSATLKARRIAECRTFTHNPCGEAFGSALHRVRINRRRWLLGENLTWGAGGRRTTALAALRRWLDSPAHRRLMLDPRFTHMGVRRRRLALKGAPRGAVLWVLHIGTRLR